MGEATTTPTGVVCPICGWAGDIFEPMGRIPRPNARCPRCHSLERHRAIFLFLKNATEIFTEPTRVLHFAPERGLRRIFDRHENIEYITTDLETPDVSIQMDIGDLLFRDDVFDCVICSHVLEHVPDDRAAMREIGRVLRPNGFALLLVPILSRLDGKTVEDPSIVTPEERQRVFGQADHVRAYGQDFAERVREAGLDVTVHRHSEELGSDLTSHFALNPREQLFFCRPADEPVKVSAAATADPEKGAQYDEPVEAHDNEEYWVKRHRRLRNQLAAVGDINSSEERNLELYAQKKRRVTDLLKALGRLDLSGRSVLDAGCGTGMLAEMFYALGADVTGVDASTVAVEEVRHRCPAGEFTASSLIDFRFTPRFDLTVCVDVLYHVVDDASWRAAVENLASHTKPGGYLIVGDQHKAEPSSPAPHVRFRTRDMYKNALSELSLQDQVSDHHRHFLVFRVPD